MELIIPDDQKRPFEILFKLGPPQRKALVDGLRSIKPAISLRNLAGALGQTVSLASDDLYEILRMLASLNDLRTEQLEEDEKDSGIFAMKITHVAKRDLKSLSVPDAEWDDFRRYLTDLFANAAALAITAKASEIRWENERIVCMPGCRLLSDMRPIFADKVSDQPGAVIVLHTLKLAYHSAADDVQEFYVTMDSDDLFLMHEIIERAIEKDQSLRTLLERAGLACLEG